MVPGFLQFYWQIDFAKYKYFLRLSLIAFISLAFFIKEANAAVKDIYIETNGGNKLTRVIPTGTTAVTMTGGASADFILNPQIVSNLDLSAGSIPITLRLAKAGAQTSRTVRVDLDYSNGSGGWIAIGNQSQTITINTDGVYQTFSYSITTTGVSIPSGRDLRLRITNNSSPANRHVIIRALEGGVYSRLRPTVTTFVNIDTADTYSTVYPGTTLASVFVSGDTVYIRAVVSDPFGSADITSTLIDIDDPSSTPIVVGASMTQVASTSLTKTYEYAFALGGSPPIGTWTVDLTAKEGAENLVTDLHALTFDVSATPIPDITTSTKIVTDLNGGEADPGDTLRYTIDIINSSATTSATGVVVTDDIPADVNSFTVQSFPSGATNSSTGGGTGSNGTGYLNITNITVAPSSTETIVFDVTILGATPPGTLIDNTATITPASGSPAYPAADTVIVSPSLLPSSGAKDLYIETNGGTTLTRVIPTGATEVSINGTGGSATFLLSPVISDVLTLASGNIPITLRLSKGGSQSARTVQVDFEYSDGSGGWISLGSQSQNITITTGGVFQTFNYNINLASNVSIPSGRDLRFIITNNTGNSGRTVTVRALEGGVYSRLRPVATTVINVDSVETYSTAYPGTTLAGALAQGENAYIRAVVSDPFGFADITSGLIDIVSSDSTSIISGASMTSVATSGSLRTYEYTYTIPTSPIGGNWQATVTAKEGAENLISHFALNTFAVEQANLTLVKSSSVVSDPINVTNPKRIPLAVIQYSVLATNTTRSSPNDTTVVITDVVPTNMRMCVSALCAGGTPVTFTDGSPTSALSFSYATDVTYSIQVGGGPPYNHTAVPDGNGYDNAITGFSIAPTGTMAASSGTPPHPSFTMQYYMQIK